MKRFKRIIRVLFMSVILSLAIAGMPVVFFPKRDDLFDNEVKIEKVESKKEEQELPDYSKLKE